MVGRKETIKVLGSHLLKGFLVVTMNATFRKEGILLGSAKIMRKHDPFPAAGLIVSGR